MQKERFTIIANAIAEDEEFSKKLFDMAPEDAAVKFAEKGYDFSSDELIEFGELCKQAADQNGELDESNLEDVAGGVITEALFTAGVTLFLAGCGGGYLISKKW